MAYSELVWMNGEIVPSEKATVHVSTEAVLRGQSAYEGIRGYWNRDVGEVYLFRTVEHLRRLRQTCRIMRMAVPFSDEAFTNGFVELTRRSRWQENIYFRPFVYLGTGERSTGAFILARPRVREKSVVAGVSACTSTWRRNSDLAMPSRLKVAANYHNSRMASLEAKQNAYDDPIMLNERGKVAEGAYACVMIVRDGVVVTPPVSSDILESITRATLIELIQAELAMRVVEREVDRTELYIADEVFLCATGAEIVPVLSVDRYDVGSGKVGPVTASVQRLYFGVAEGRVEKYRRWLTPVYGDR